MLRKKITALNEENFRPFGQVIRMPEEITIEPGAVHGWKVVANIPYPGEVEVGWLLLKQRPYEVTQLEHHLHTPELVVPLDTPFLVPVAPADNNPEAIPDPDKIEGFVVEPGQALVLDQCGWHWLPFPVKGNGSCLIVFGKDTPADDLLIKNLAGGESIQFVE